MYPLGERTRHIRVSKVILAGKNQCLRNACSPGKYNNSLHRQVCVKVFLSNYKTRLEISSS